MLPLIIAAFHRSRRRFRPSLDSLADLGCGTGGFLAHLAGHVPRLYGIDRSDEMLALAGQRLRKGDAVLMRQDLRALTLSERVGAMTCNADTVNYLALPHQLERFLAAAARNLREGGHLMFDFIAQGAGAGQTPQARHTLRLGRTTAEMTMTIDPDRRGSTVVIKIATPKRAPHVERHRQHWPSPDVVRAALARHGLRTLSRAPMVAGGASGWLHVVAQKTGKTVS